MIKKITLLLLICFGFCNVFAIQTLTLKQARKLALQNNPGLLAEKSKLDASKNNADKAFLALMPSASANGIYQKLDEAPSMMGINGQDRAFLTNIKVNQPIFNGGKFWLGWKIAKDSNKINKHGYNNKKLSIISAVDKAYFDVLQAKKMLKIAKADLRATNKHLEIAKSKSLAGTLSQVELLRLESEKANREVKLIQSKSFVKTAKQMLASTIQLNVNEFTITQVSIDPDDLLFNKLASLNVVNLENFTVKAVNFAKSNSNVLKISKTSLDISKKSLSLAKGNFLPSLFLSYTYNYNEDTDRNDDWSDSSTIMLNASIPIFPLYDNYLGVNKAKNELNQSKYTYKQSLDNITLGVKNSCYNLAAKASTVKAAKKSLEVSKRFFEGMQQRFTSGLINTADLIDAQLSYFNAQNFYLNSTYNYLTAKSNLLEQIGSENQQDLLKLLGE